MSRVLYQLSYTAGRAAKHISAPRRGPERRAQGHSER